MRALHRKNYHNPSAAKSAEFLVVSSRLREQR